MFAPHGSMTRHPYEQRTHDMPRSWENLPNHENLSPRIDTVDRLICFRTTSPNRDALLVQGACAWGGRYHRAGQPKPLYASLSETTPVHELERRSGIKLTGATVRMTQLSVSGRLLNVVDPDGQQGLQVSIGDLISPDLTLCHAIANFALSLSVSGLLVPSAAMPRETNLVIFFDSIDETVSEISWTLMTI